jgi:hypothetical protein
MSLPRRGSIIRSRQRLRAQLSNTDRGTRGPRWQAVAVVKQTNQSKAKTALPVGIASQDIQKLVR